MSAITTQDMIAVNFINYFKFSFDVIAFVSYLVLVTDV